MKKNMVSKNKKPFYQKWWFIVLVVLAAMGALMDLLGTETKESKERETIVETVSSTPEKKPIKKEIKESEKSSDAGNKTDYTATNLLIAEDLQMSLGWALGNATDYGTPDEGFAWAVFIEKIELSEEDDQLNVYVTPEFLGLDDVLKQDYIRTAQNSSIQYTEDGERIFTVIFSDYETIGRSKISDISSFKFNK